MLPSLGVVALGAFLIRAHAATLSDDKSSALGCEAWLGDFAKEPNAPAFIRIERIGDGLFARIKNDDGSWRAHPVELQEDTQQSDDNESKTQGCILAGGGAKFIKAPKGTAYQATSVTGQNFATLHMNTDSLMLVVQGFQVDGQDLYRVASKGPSPLPVPSSDKGKPAKGR
ncbi:hypothetical protein [Xanthomonas oryzae]|uniref:hypothetical protein n=1 Tax=Xanthomonas oryzae TaxID=347 RepID=UPI001300C8B1|nr:hypothetical protein [Xanthomonas oryzae]